MQNALLAKAAKLPKQTGHQRRRVCGEPRVQGGYFRLCHSIAARSRTVKTRTSHAFSAAVGARLSFLKHRTRCIPDFMQRDRFAIDKVTPGAVLAAVHDDVDLEHVGRWNTDILDAVGVR